MHHRVYIGPHDEVEVPALGGVVVRRGEPVEVDAATAELLDAQPDTWAKTNTTAAEQVREQVAAAADARAADEAAAAAAGEPDDVDDDDDTDDTDDDEETSR